MTTQKQVGALLKSLVDRHPDLAVVGRWLMVKPIQHVLRGVLVDRTSEAEWFRPKWAVTHFCDPNGHFPLNWGERILAEGEGQWRWSDPAMPDMLANILECRIFPLLRRMTTLEETVATLASKEREHPKFDVGWNLLRYLPLQVARGELESARVVLGKLLSGETLWSASALADEFSAVVTPLKPLLDKDDREGLAVVLHKWERMRILNLKMQTIWHPTPFPLETLAGGEGPR